MKIYRFCLLFLLLLGTLPATSDVRRTQRPTPPNRQATFAITEDYAVLETALKDFLTIKDNKNPFHKAADSIVLYDGTVGESGMLDDTQISCELMSSKLSLPPELGSSLRIRNVRSVSLNKMKGRHKKIIVKEPNKPKKNNAVSSWESFYRSYPQAKAYAQSWLPGYSKDSRQAVVRFWFGPTAHGAIATYMLVKRSGVWKVKWRNLSYYV